MENMVAVITSSNEFLVDCFGKDSLYHDLTNPTSNGHYKEVKQKLEEKYGSDEVKTFNKQVMKELKEKGWM